MRKAFLGVTVFGFCLILLVPSQVLASGTTRVVDDDGKATPSNCNSTTPTFNSIQAAVNASNSGDTILVCPGLYPEQVKIVTKNLTIRGIASGNENLALVRPVAMLPNSTSAATGNPISAVVVVEGSRSVTLNNLTIDGANNLIGGCAPTLVGIFYRNASGKVEASAVRNIRLDAGLEGCQSGIGIFAQTGTAGVGAAGSPSKLTVLGTSVHDYQKNGISANENGTELYAFANAVAGFGATPDIAQNGIQIGFGATGTIANNSIVNHVYSLCVDAANCSFVSTNVLVFESDEVKVSGNIVAKAQVNIYLVTSNKSEVTANGVSDSDVWDAIAIVGDNNRAQYNFAFNSDESGIYVQGNFNKVQYNTINDAPCGVFEDSPSSGNTLTNNVFFNTQLKMCTATVAPLFQSTSVVGAAALPSAQPVR